MNLAGNRGSGSSEGSCSRSVRREVPWSARRPQSNGYQTPASVGVTTDHTCPYTINNAVAFDVVHENE